MPLMAPVYWGEAVFSARRWAGFAADDPLCSSCYCNHGSAALPASLDPERIKWSATTDWGPGDPPGSFGEDGAMCVCCAQGQLCARGVCCVWACLCAFHLACVVVRRCLHRGGVSGVFAPGVEERVTVPRLDRRPCAGRWQGAPLLFLSATVPLLVRLDARVWVLPRSLGPRCRSVTSGRFWCEYEEYEDLCD